MIQKLKQPQNDFEVIGHFEAYRDEDLGLRMIEFYQEQRDNGIPLGVAFLRTLQIFSSIDLRAA